MSTYLPTQQPTTHPPYKPTSQPNQSTKKKTKPSQPTKPTTWSKALPKKLTGQEIPHILRNRMVYCRIHNNPTPVPVQNQMDPD